MMTTAVEIPDVKAAEKRVRALARKHKAEILRTQREMARRMRKEQLELISSLQAAIAKAQMEDDGEPEDEELIDATAVLENLEYRIDSDYETGFSFGAFEAILG